MAGDQVRRDCVGAEHSTIEQPSRPAGSHALAGRLPQALHLQVHGRRQCRHGPLNACHNVRRHLVHDKSGRHCLSFLPAHADSKARSAKGGRAMSHPIIITNRQHQAQSIGDTTAFA